MPFFTKIASGVTCGALASGLFNPCDVVKVRMQADGMGAAKGTPARYSGLVNAFTTIGRTEGLGGLYKVRRARAMGRRTHLTASLPAGRVAHHATCKHRRGRRARHVRRVQDGACTRRYAPRRLLQHAHDVAHVRSS